MPQQSDRRCPYCFAAVPREHKLVACSVGRQANGADKCSEADFVYAKPDENRVCKQHRVNLDVFCQGKDCWRQLPEGWMNITTTCLAMAGTRAAGKTVYIAMAANQLARWGRLNGLAVSHYTKGHKRSFEARFGRLDPKAKMYESTEPEVPGAPAQKHQMPVILRLQRPGRPDHALVLRDVAGEDMQNPHMDRSHFRFLAHADGIVLLVDSGESDVIRRTGVVDQQTAVSFQSSGVWGNLEQLGREVLGDQAKPVPMAVTLSKFDLVLSAADVESSELGMRTLSTRGSHLRMDPSLRPGGFDIVDSDLLDQELRSLCIQLHFNDLLQRAEHYGLRAPTRFFAVSSLGHAPMLGKVANHGTVPFRCLDPIKWFLSEAGVLPASRSA